MNENKTIESQERKVLKENLGSIFTNGERKIGNNQELKRSYGELDKVMKKGRLGWLSHGGVNATRKTAQKGDDVWEPVKS